MEITMHCRACGLAVADFDIVKDEKGEPYLKCRRCGWLYTEGEERKFTNYFKKVFNTD